MNRTRKCGSNGKENPVVVGWMPTDIGLDERFTYRRLGVYHDKPDPEVCPMDWNAIDGTDPTSSRPSLK